MDRRVALLEDKVTATVAIGARPNAAGDGLDITTWRVGAFTPERAVAMIDGSIAAALTAPAAGLDGVEIWGYILGQWWLIGSLNGRQQVNIASDTQGYAEEIADIGACTRLAVAATVSAGAATVKFCPLECLQ